MIQQNFYSFHSPESGNGLTFVFFLLKLSFKIPAFLYPRHSECFQVFSLIFTH